MYEFGGGKSGSGSLEIVDSSPPSNVVMRLVMLKPFKADNTVRFTLQPLDVPKTDPDKLLRTLEHIGSDSVFLFSTDYPHWHFDGDDVLPEGLTESTLQKLLNDNALETYPRLREGGMIEKTQASAGRVPSGGAG